MDSKELVTIDTEKYKSEYIKYHEFYDFIKSGQKMVLICPAYSNLFLIAWPWQQG